MNYFKKTYSLVYRTILPFLIGILCLLITAYFLLPALLLPSGFLIVTCFALGALGILYAMIGYYYASVNFKKPFIHKGKEDENSLQEDESWLQSENDKSCLQNENNEKNRALLLLLPIGFFIGGILHISPILVAVAFFSIAAGIFYQITNNFFADKLVNKSYMYFTGGTAITCFVTIGILLTIVAHIKTLPIGLIVLSSIMLFIFAMIVLRSSILRNTHTNISCSPILEPICFSQSMNYSVKDGKEEPSILYPIVQNNDYLESESESENESENENENSTFTSVSLARD